MWRKESSRVLIVEKEQEGGCDAGLKGTLKCSESGASDQTLLLVATCRHITHSRCLWSSDAIVTVAARNLDVDGRRLQCFEER
jgi:hypothetical protein